MGKKVVDYRRGEGVFWKDGMWTIQSMDHVKPGKGPAYVQAELKNVETGQVVGNRFRCEEQLEQVIFDRRKMEYLYSDGTNHVFMDQESYEQTEIPQEVIGERSHYLTPNCVCEICFVQGRIIDVELPNTVELKIIECPPQIKGATATNQPKEATLEGGARVRVPAFIECGEVIRVDTRTSEYLGRA